MIGFWKWLTSLFARDISPILCRSGPVADADLKFPDKFARLVAGLMDDKPVAPLPDRCCGTCTARSSDGVCRQVFTTPKKWRRPDGVVLDRAVMRDDAGQSCGFWSDDPEYMTPRPKGEDRGNQPAESDPSGGIVPSNEASVECSNCGGSGLPTASTRLSRCPYCRGTGRITAPPEPATSGRRTKGDSDGLT